MNDMPDTNPRTSNAVAFSAGATGEEAPQMTPQATPVAGTSVPPEVAAAVQQHVEGFKRRHGIGALVENLAEGMGGDSAKREILEPNS